MAQRDCLTTGREVHPSAGLTLRSLATPAAGIEAVFQVPMPVLVARCEGDHLSGDRYSKKKG